MKKNTIINLESYFKTENEHWNGFTFKMLCELLKIDIFESPEIPLNIFKESLDIIKEQSKTPLLAVQTVILDIEKQKLEIHQELFIYEKITDYLGRTEYDEFDTFEMEQLLKSHFEMTKNKTSDIAQDKSQPVVGSIRENLKSIIQSELSKLPETLEQIDPEKRLEILCKIIPYVLPKVHSIQSDKGESDQNSITGISGYKW